MVPEGSEPNILKSAQYLCVAFPLGEFVLGDRYKARSLEGGRGLPLRGREAMQTFGDFVTLEDKIRAWACRGSQD